MGKALCFPNPWLRRNSVRFVALALTVLPPGSTCRTALGARANGLLDRTRGTGLIHNRVFGEGQGQETQDRHRKPPGVCRYYAPGLEGRVPNLLGTPLRSCAEAPRRESACRSKG